MPTGVARRWRMICGLVAVVSLPCSVTGQVPDEPVAVRRGVPQFFINDWLVDNRYGIRYKSTSVVHTVHPPRKHPANPVYEGDCGYVSVAKLPHSDKFQMWTQVHASGNLSAERRPVHADCRIACDRPGLSDRRSL